MNLLLRVVRSLFAVSCLVGLAGAAQAEKVNLVYIEDAPAPIGSITMEQIEALAASDFTHVVFAFINLCTPPSNEGGNPTCPGTAPVPVWNIGPAYHHYDGAPFPQAQKAMRTLSGAGKTLYMSLGGAVNPETWNYMASASTKDQATAVNKLLKFMKDYSLTGVDFDYESGSSEGFGLMAKGLFSADNSITFSSAPYNTDPTATHSTSTQWQYCTFMKNGITPSLINRQYYSGGAIYNILEGVKEDLAAFKCDSVGESKKIPPALMNPGLGVSGPKSPWISWPPSCTAPENCAAIGKMIVEKVPGIAGMAVWNYQGLSNPSAPSSNPKQYACKMSNALNNTSKACTSDIDVGPIWNNDDAKVKCSVAAAAVNGTWNGQWNTTVEGKMSFCRIIF